MNQMKLQENKNYFYFPYLYPTSLYPQEENFWNQDTNNVDEVHLDVLEIF